MGHVGTATAFATELGGDVVDEVARTEAVRAVFGDAGDEADFLVFDGGKQHDTGLKLVFELID